MDHPLFKRAFWLLVLIGILHNAAIFFYIYWTIWWSDIVMHFLGGFWVGLVALWLYEMPEIRQRIGHISALKVALITALVVSTGWEIYEYVFDISGVASELYIKDTALDFVMALSGALAAVFYASRLTKKFRNNEKL